jgi:hypothetical protein
MMPGLIIPGDPRGDRSYVSPGEGVRHRAVSGDTGDTGDILPPLGAEKTREGLLARAPPSFWTSKDVEVSPVSPVSPGRPENSHSRHRLISGDPYGGIAGVSPVRRGTGSKLPHRLQETLSTDAPVSPTYIPKSHSPVRDGGSFPHRFATWVLRGTR